MDMLFNLLNASVLPAWAMLILAPRWKVTQAVVHSMLYPVVLGAAYTLAMVLAMMGMGSSDVDFTTIAGVRAIFESDLGVLTGWTHYLVFDLFVGAWVARDAVARGVRHWMTVPCLILCFMAGPMGLLLYLGVRAVVRKGGWGLDPSTKTNAGSDAFP